MVVAKNHFLKSQNSIFQFFKNKKNKKISKFSKNFKNYFFIFKPFLILSFF